MPLAAKWLQPRHNLRAPLTCRVADAITRPAYLNTSVTHVSSPKSVQPSLDGGVLINASVVTALSAGAVNACQLFDAVVERIQGNGGYVARKFAAEPVHIRAGARRRVCVLAL